MSTHFSFDYECAGCRERYLPFDESNRGCPRCGQDAPPMDDVPTIESIVEAARVDRHLPFAIISTADVYVMLAMQAINYSDRRPPASSDGVDRLVREMIDGADFSGVEHRRSHTEAFVRAVLREAYKN